MGRLDGRVAIITGAARGIGRGIAVAFACEGAVLALVDRDERMLEETRETCSARGAEPIAIAAAKSGVHGFTRALAYEVAPYNITANVIARGRSRPTCCGPTRRSGSTPSARRSRSGVSVGSRRSRRPLSYSPRKTAPTTQDPR
jgi:NAD(P)-dependent dehydrogenase (short-subunit alcohol dehydrogenase family)